MGPLPLDELRLAVGRARRFRSHPLTNAERLASALGAAGAIRDDQGRWRAPADATAPDRYQALAVIAGGRDLTRSEMVQALLGAGYASTSASIKKIDDHPLIRRTGPDRYQLLLSDNDN